MLRIPIEQAKAGMVLARSVPNPEKPRHILLKAGYLLDLDSVKRLRKLRVYGLWIRYPSLDFLDDVLDPELTRWQQGLYATLKENFSQNQKLSPAKLNYNDYIEQIRGLFNCLLNSQGKASALIHELHGEADDLFVHGTSVAYLALLIGMRLKSYLIQERPRVSARLATDLTQLGVGALLHDIGKLSLPEKLRTFHLTAQDRGDPTWQQHTEAGRKMVKGGLDPTAAKIVLDHHQHFDGSGFPPRKAVPGLTDQVVPLQGKEIHIFCRIATLADRFENFRHLPDGRTAPTVVALKRIRNPGYAKWFDPVVFQAFIESVPPFVPGDQVLLNDGQSVVVTEINDKFPHRPSVKPVDLDLAIEPDKQNLTNENKQEEENDIDLAVRNDLHIAKIGDFDVTAYLE